MCWPSSSISSVGEVATRSLSTTSTRCRSRRSSTTPKADRDDGISTRNQRQAALNSFFSFVRAGKPVFYSKITQEMEVPRKHSTPPVMEYLTVAEVEALFSSIDDSTKHGLREKAMIGFPYEGTARIGKLTSFRHCQLRLEMPLRQAAREGRQDKERSHHKGIREADWHLRLGFRDK